MKTYPTWESIPHDRDGLIPELIEKHAVTCVNAYPKLVAQLKKYYGNHLLDRSARKRRADDCEKLLKELGELE